MTEKFFTFGSAVNDKIGRQALSQLPFNPLSFVSPEDKRNGKDDTGTN